MGCTSSNTAVIDSVSSVKGDNHTNNASSSRPYQHNGSVSESQSSEAPILPTSTTAQLYAVPILAPAPAPAPVETTANHQHSLKQSIEKIDEKDAEAVESKSNGKVIAVDDIHIESVLKDAPEKAETNETPAEIEENQPCCQTIVHHQETISEPEPILMPAPQLEVAPELAPAPESSPDEHQNKIDAVCESEAVPADETQHNVDVEIKTETEVVAVVPEIPLSCNESNDVAQVQEVVNNSEQVVSSSDHATVAANETSSTQHHEKTNENEHEHENEGEKGSVHEQEHAQEHVPEVQQVVVEHEQEQNHEKDEKQSVENALEQAESKPELETEQVQKEKEEPVPEHEQPQTNAHVEELQEQQPQQVHEQDGKLHDEHEAAQVKDSGKKEGEENDNKHMDDHEHEQQVEESESPIKVEIIEQVEVTLPSPTDKLSSEDANVEATNEDKQEVPNNEIHEEGNVEHQHEHENHIEQVAAE